ncbi:unnamed protein product [Schistosoma mattheei]|uniref:Uncharacterized protein n=1 Tax=Schistosoma mattheei TaxID=31246 RepID=A0A183PN94_9TREM|nr:unnamed protein product [Schistosoma mattheei]
MSLLKGVLELETLELEENALMELLDLPTWLLLRKAYCTNVVAKLSRFCVLSKSPNWQNCLLNLSTLTLPQYDSILIFKEVSWESARIVADGLLTELHGTPVKLITNQSRVRLTMKKRLSDGSLISSRIRLILDDILWVFTLSQVEAAIVFARSLEHSIRLANEQSKRFAAEKAKVSM